MMQFPLEIAFVKHLGFELIKFEGGEAEIHCAVQPHMLNTWQIAHGGLVMTLLDVCMAHAARSSEPRDQPAAPGLVTLEMKTQFMRPGEDYLVAKAKILHRTATLAFTEGSVYSRRADGSLSELCAHATGTFKYLKAIATSSQAEGGRDVKKIIPKASD
ncbi:MAG: PaaI family thioesterase [Brachymonas sp.]|nr:PaaI family thioesterase [Brachymonas sp.]